MKKLLILAAALFVGASLSAQAQLQVGGDVNYYGVDFSEARTFGASESGEQFVKAFEEINALVIGEWKKYNPGKFLLKNIVVQDISVTQARNNTIDGSDLALTSAAYLIREDNIAPMIKRYEIKESEGIGLVILGELMNKQAGRGTFIAVYFDIASRQVLYYLPLSGKAGGFGLRNFWAKALHNGLQSER